MQIGPIQIVAVGFEQPEFKGEILRELDAAREQGLIRLVDALAVHKGLDGTLTSIETSDVSRDEAILYGAVIGGLLGLGFAGEAGADEGEVAGALAMADAHDYGIGAEAFDRIADNIPAGGAALLMLVEHSWAIPLASAMRNAGGTPLALDFLSPELLISQGAALGAALQITGGSI